MATMSIQETGDRLDPGRVKGIDEAWPPEDSVTRLEAYERGRMIFDGEHRDAFDPNSDFTTRAGNYIVCNLAELIVKACADLLFGQDISLEFPRDTSEATQDAIRSFWDEQELQLKCYESALDCGAQGDAIFQVMKEDGEVSIEPVPVSTWFPTHDPDNKRRILEHSLEWKRTELASNGETVELVKKRIYQKGQILNELWLLEKGRLFKKYSSDSPEWALVMGPTVDELEEIPEVENDFLLIHIPNWRPARAFFGYSDYKTLYSMISALNMRLTQYNHVLENHADPITKGPVGVVDEFGEFRRQEIDYVEIEDKESDTLEYLTYDASLADSKALIDELTDKILLIAETDKTLLGIEGGSGPISGRALKLSIQRTLAKVNRKRKYWSRAIPKALVIAQRLQGDREPVKPKVVWPEGMPQDIIEKLDEIQQRRSLGLISRRRAVQRLDSVDADRAQEMIDEADADVASELKPFKGAVTGGIQPAPINVTVGPPTQEELV